MKILQRIIPITPLRTGILLTLLAVYGYYAWVVDNPVGSFSVLVRTLDWRVHDAMFRFRGEEPVGGEVVIVDIDEISLLEPASGGLGQWPWPRSKMAAILNNLAADGAKVIGLDVVYAEEDRTSPRRFIDLFKSKLEGRVEPELLDGLRTDPEFDHDRILAGALEKTPTVLGYFVEMEEKANVLLTGAEHGTISSAYSALISQFKPEFKPAFDLLICGYRPVMNLALFSDACLSSGFFNPSPDIDGVVRTVPLMMRFFPKESGEKVEGVDLFQQYADGVIYPSLAFEMLREGLAIQPEEVEIVFTPRGIIGIHLGKRFVPTDLHGRVMVNFRGEKNTFSYVSAVDVFHNRFTPGAFKDRFVLIGPTAGGLQDLRATPMDSAFPGVEVHANIIDNVLAGDSFVYDTLKERSLVLLLILVVGLLVSLVIAYAGPLWGGCGILASVVGVLAGNYYLAFLQNEQLGMVYPVLTFLLIGVGVALTSTFTEGRQRRFIRGAFGHYLSPAVVAELEKHPERLNLGGEKRKLTVLFSDIRGFTTMSEQMDPHQLSTFLNEYLTAMSDLVMENDGLVDKYMGDAIMAFWGAPVEDHAHASKAARTALAMMRRLKELQAEWRAKGYPELDIGIGINTGVMHVGNMGSHSRFDYTVMGDNVNLASRLEGANKPYGTHILIAEETYESIRSQFYAQIVDLVRVKGKKEPVRIYELLGEGVPDPVISDTILRYQEMREHYVRQKFDEAEAILRSLQLREDRILYQVYLERIEHYRQHPPEEGWDGAYTMTSK